jgi:hypothetical protein
MSASITIGCQGGGPETAPVGRSKVNLYHALARHVKSTHCDAIDEFGVVLRVDGSLDKFGREGITRLRFAKKRRYITVDIQIPESVWTPLGDLELRQYLGAQVSAAVRVCVTRLQKDGHVVDDAELMRKVDAAVSEYTLETKEANKTLVDNRLPAPSRNDPLHYNP